MPSGFVALRMQGILFGRSFLGWANFGSSHVRVDKILVWVQLGQVILISGQLMLVEIKLSCRVVEANTFRGNS